MSLADLRRIQAEKLRHLLAEVYPANPFYRRRLENSGWKNALLDPSVDLDDLVAALPLTTKAELVADQERHPPYGTNLTYPAARYSRLHRTSGTSTGRSLFWLDTPASWQWIIDCWKRVYGGLRLVPDDRVFVPFSFGPFIGFWGAFEAAQQLEVFSLPGGGLSTVTRLHSIIEHGMTVVACTPTYALRLAEVARDEGIDLHDSRVRALVVAGEPGGHVAGTRKRIEECWGARVFDHHGMTEIGCVSYEIDGGPGGLHIVEDEFVVEILDPQSDSPVPDGVLGELVLTGLGRAGSPLLRYRTGDIVRWVAEEPAIPRADGTFGSGRLDGGIVGRADDMIFVRGNNVYPSALEAILRDFTEVAEYRLRVLESVDLSTLEIELEARPTADSTGSTAETKDCHRREHRGRNAANEDLAERVARAIEERLLFRASVRLLPPGSLPRYEMKAQRLVRESKTVRTEVPDGDVET